MAEHPIEAKRRAGERMRAGGLARHLVLRGVLLRGIPMGIAVVLLLDLLQGAPAGASWREPAFLARFVLAVALFSLGGMLSAYARWRALDTRFGGPRLGG
jgi:hypothetical protein